MRPRAQRPQVVFREKCLAFSPLAALYRAAALDDRRVTSVW